MVELRLLGTVELRREDGGTVQSVTVQPKRLALLAYLAAARPRGPHRRDVLLGLLWPELDTDRARAALSKALHHLRSSLGAHAVVNHGEDAVEVDATKVVSDVVRFEGALAAGRYEIALDLYAGDLLHGFFVSDAPEFEHWLDAERARLRSSAADAAAALSARHEAAGDLEASIAAARRALELAGSQEPVARRLMTLLDRAGDRAGALTVYDAFAADLRRDLDIEPAPETRALAASIRERGDARTHATAAANDARATRGSIGTVPEVAPAALARDEPGAPGPDPGLPVPARQWRFVSAAIVVILAAAGMLAYRAVPRTEALLEPRRILVLPFDNRTLDEGLDPVGRMAADWITDGVSRMGGFEVVPSTAVWAAQGAVPAREASEQGETIRRVAQEVGAGTVLSGAYYRDGTNVVLQARAHDAATGRVLRPIGAITVSADSLVLGIDRLRTRVLAALATLGDTVYHLRAAAPPPTYEAYREYITAMDAFVSGDPARALRHYQMAASADSAWAMPRIASAIMHMNLGSDAAADSIIAPLNAGRERLGPLERGTVDMVTGMLHGRPAAVYDAVSALGRIAPGTINEYMVAEMARKMNRPAEALEVLARMGPERGELRGWRAFWREAAWSHHMLGDHRAELYTAGQARSLYPHSPFVLSLELRALAALGRIDEVRDRIDQRVVNTSTGWPTAGDLMSIAFRELASHGHEAAAAAFAEHAVTWYRSRIAEQPDNTTLRARFARALLDAGRLDEAEDAYRVVRDVAPDDPVTNATLALVLARRGDLDAAAELSDRAGLYRHPQGRTGPINRLRGEHMLLRAAVAAHRGDRAAAVQLLRSAESDGLWFDPDVLCRPELNVLRGDADFEAWRRPRALP